jgi:hypothetical protein
LKTDWLGNGQNVREVHHKEGWKRNSSNLNWTSFEQAFFDRVSPDAGAQNYINNYDGGIINDFYFIKSGGTTSPNTNTAGTVLNLNNPNSTPNFDIGDVITYSANLNITNLEVNWSISTEKTPQLSYHLKIYDNQNYTGTPLIKENVVAPHIRNTDIDISSLPNNMEYYVKFNIIDIFDNQSISKTSSFIIGNLSTDSDIIKNLTVFPNPFNNEINLKLSLTNTIGLVIYSNEYNNIEELILPINISNGVYLLNLNTNLGEKIIKVIKQ